MPDTPRVLIIEDHDILRVMLFTVLRHEPLGVDTATSTEEAMARVRTCDYALILIDMGMANGSADEFLARFRAERAAANSFIIAVRDPKSEKAIDSSAVSAVLNKPLEIDTLADVVRECAAVVPPPEEPVGADCPPAENDIRAALDRASMVSN